MLDQCHNLEPKVPAEIRSVMNVQEATAKALFVDRSALAKAQMDGDVLEANGILVDAFNTDVRPLLGELREDMGLDPDPLGAYRGPGYAEKIIAERAAGTAAGWGRDALTFDDPPARSSSYSNARTGSVLTRATRITPAGTPRPRQSSLTHPVATRPKSCGSRVRAATSARCEAGLAVMRIDRLRSLTRVYRARSARTRWSRPSISACSEGRGRAVDRHRDARPRRKHHVDHLHPDAGIALATSADGEALTGRSSKRRVHWVPWRRPGFQLGLDIAAIHARQPSGSIGVILGGHGITAWGDTSEECEAEFAAHHPHRRGLHRRSTADPSRFGPALEGFLRLDPADRRRRATEIFPAIRGMARPIAPRSVTSATATRCSGSSSPSATRSWPNRGSSCPDHFLRTKVRPMVLDVEANASAEEMLARLASCTSSIARSTPRTTSASPRPNRPRCAGRTRPSCSCRVSGCSRSARTRRPRASPESSTSMPSTS